MYQSKKHKKAVGKVNTVRRRRGKNKTPEWEPSRAMIDGAVKEYFKKGGQVTKLKPESVPPCSLRHKEDDADSYLSGR